MTRISSQMGPRKTLEIPPNINIGQKSHKSLILLNFSPLDAIFAQEIM